MQEHILSEVKCKLKDNFMISMLNKNKQKFKPKTLYNKVFYLRTMI